MGSRKQAIELFALAAREEGTDTSDWIPVPKDCVGLTLVLDVTAAATDAADTLDVVVSTKIGTETAINIQYFTQVLGNGGVKRYIANIVPNVTVTEYAYAALTAATKKDILGDSIQCKWTIVNSSTDDEGFIFSVYAMPF